MSVEGPLKETPGHSPLGRRMESDHERLDELWDTGLAKWSSERPQATVLLREFRDGLLRHIQVEEDLLFPYFEARGGPGERPLVGLLLDEHKEIRAMLQRFMEQVERGTPSLEDAGTALRNVLWAHNTREEGLLYPWFNDGLDVGTGAELDFQVRAEIGSGDSPRT